MNPLLWMLSCWTVFACVLIGWVAFRAWQRRRPYRTTCGPALERQAPHCMPPRPSPPSPAPARPTALRIVIARDAAAAAAKAAAAVKAFRADVARDAAAAARHDFHNVRRRRANPHTRHTRAFACWALEYAATWEALAVAHNPDLSQPNPHRSGHAPVYPGDR